MRKLIATVVAVAVVVGGGMVALVPTPAFAKSVSKCAEIKNPVAKKSCLAEQAAARKQKK